MKRLVTLFSSFIIGLLCSYLIAPYPANALSSWVPVNTMKFGDSDNFQVYSLEPYDGYLYAGTYTASNGGQIWEYDLSTWTKINTNGFGDASNDYISAMLDYNGYLIAGTINDSTGAEVWQYDGSTWSQINGDGFGNAAYTGIDALENHNDTLYAGIQYANGGYIFMYSSGISWAANMTPGFSDTNNDSIYSLKSFNDNLYAATYNLHTGTEIWEMSGVTWTQVSLDGFGDQFNSFSKLEVFNNQLYAVTTNLVTGVEVWRYSGSGTSWTQVNSDGFGDASVLNGEDIHVYNGTLYIITNPWEIFAYDGSTWSRETLPTYGTPTCLSTYMGGLYAGTGIAYVETAYAEAELELDITAAYEEVSSYAITYTATIINNGPDTASNVLFTATIPDGSTYVSGTGTDWSCSAMGQNVTCFRSSLAANTSTVITLVVHVEDEGEYELIASVNSDTSDLAQANNSETLQINVRALAETGANVLPFMLLGVMLITVSLRKKLYN